jgi:hypothetical protein
VTLLRRLDMMEVERTHVEVVSASAARTASILDENRLYLPAPARHSGRSASLAAVEATPIETELDLPVAAATHHHRGKPSQSA